MENMIYPWLAFFSHIELPENIFLEKIPKKSTGPMHAHIHVDQILSEANHLWCHGKVHIC